MPRFDLPLDQLRTREPDATVPADFDAFWSATLAASRVGALAPIATPHPQPLPHVDVHDVEFPGFGGEPVRAWLVRPAGTTSPLPGIVEFVGYGRGRGLFHERLHWPAAGFAQLIVDTRGQGSTYGTGGATPDPHGSAPATPGFLTRGILDPADYYYRRVFTDAARAVDALRLLPGVDGQRIAVTGNSQGGLLAIAAAALGEGVAACLPSAPILCDTPRVIGLTGQDPHAEIERYLAVHRDPAIAETLFRTLSYFDGANLATRASAPALFSCGHCDTIAPPSGVYAAYRRWGGDAEMIDYPWNHHEGGEGLHWLRQIEWLSARFGL
ncbi:acetylxylan esterase [Micrococcales bacterium 31B]|nr:acetylxylan esterase [Micrococcales bacterium 31B]